MEPTIPLYMQYPALDLRALICETIVLAADRDQDGRNYIVVRETTVHPAGGGQRADDANIDGVHVADARRERETGRILHYLDGPPPAVGAAVRITVSGETRLRNAALHGAGHLLAMLADRHITGTTIRAGHHYPGEARISGACIKAPEDMAAVVQTLQRHVDEAVRQEWPIISTFTAARREIAIDDGRPEGCGGTHLPHCGFLRDLKVLKVNHQKGELRVRYSVLGV